jgi:hypothetical protein
VRFRVKRKERERRVIRGCHSQGGLDTRAMCCQHRRDMIIGGKGREERDAHAWDTIVTSRAQGGLQPKKKV